VRLVAKDMTPIMTTAEGEGDTEGDPPLRVALPINSPRPSQASVLVVETSPEKALTELDSEASAVVSRLAGLVSTASALCQAVSRVQLDNVAVLAATMDAIDPYKRGSSEAVRDLAVALGDAAGMDSDALEALGYAALLRDLGMIRVDRSFATSARSLTEDEWEGMRGHPEASAALLEPIGFLRPAAEVVRSHHERWDGSGYPHGLSGERIPLGARILSVAETHTAITSDRPHRGARDELSALAEMRALAGRQFDPQIVALLERLTRQAQPAAEPAGKE